MAAVKNTKKVNGIDVHICSSSRSEPHSHDFLELAYVAEGEARHLLNGEESVVSRGDFFILDYDAEHAYYSMGNGRLEVINCLFLPEFIDRSLKECQNFNDVVNSYMLKYNYSTVNISPANYIFHDESGEVLDILKRMLAEYEKRRSGFHELLRCHLVEIIIRTMRLSTPSAPVCHDSLCTRIIEYADAHLTEKNILGRVAAEVNFSVPYLSRRFKEVMGLPFSEYLSGMRVERCCQLLANTDKRITEVAQLSGYSDMKFFGSLFKKRTGITPREFKRKTRG